MGSVYKLFWTQHALNELQNTVEYLEQRFSAREVEKLAVRIDLILRLISENPSLYPCSKRRNNVRKAVVTKFNTLYYRVKDKQIEVLSFFSTRQNPEMRKF